ncbi:hypothetical protein Desti_2938 [Desulfomonile tiedjei DSM 6799]|uniref:Uncharacterized protein n=1 Tax=Desulfomonile tiedjei (strain ATCC 49306 / DSM 6799 / DCB-1) TaxID=706587 RepID=I4C7R6_DESTA|nr:hypothetical protein Desti_2938 [Desulfomonile tiedjei DSM 6799]
MSRSASSHPGGLFGIVRKGPPIAFLSICLLLAILWVCCFAAENQPYSTTPPLSPIPVENSGTSDLSYPLWWGEAPKVDSGTPCKEPGTCITCHTSTTTMDASHAFACVQCHKGDSSAVEEKDAHQGLIKDPGDLNHAEQTCGKCHPEEVRRVRHSAMALAPRTINHTRFSFGAQKDASPQYATVKTDALKQVPHPSESGNLGDDLLRRSCLRCHLHTPGSTRWGEHRGVGCSACHAAFPNSADGRPREHAIVRQAGMTACLKCHNANHVGADYVGLYERDFHRGFKSPLVQGRLAPTIYGAEQHRLLPDVHFRAGMTCIDCHTLDEVHGPGHLPQNQGNGVKITCESCHVNGDHPAVLKQEDGTMTLLRGAGRTIPRMNPESVPHRIDSHRNKVKCSACHAAWSFQDYGLHLMLEERPDYWKWATTAGQNDPQVQQLLRETVGTYAEILPPTGGAAAGTPEEHWKNPETFDWLSGEVRPGAWFRGYTERKWSRPPLGLDAQGRISVMRPIFQYVISHVDSGGSVQRDRWIPTTGSGTPALIMNPYAPHTIGAKGRSCQDCHGDLKAAGLGEGLRGIEKPGFHNLLLPESQLPEHRIIWDKLVDEDGNQLQYSSHAGARPLDQTTLKKLLNPSPRQKAEFYKYLIQPE